MFHIFNIIAELCSDVIRMCPEDGLFVKYSCISQPAKSGMERDIYTAVPELFLPCQKDCETLVIHQLNKNDLDGRFCDALEAHIKKIKNLDDIFSMICLLQVLDTAMKSILSEITEEYQKDSFSVVLNTNRETTGIGLLPRCSCVWERKTRLSHSYNRLDNFLVNFLLMENSILGEMIDKHYFLKPDTFPDFARKKALNIAVSPLRIESHFVYDYFEKNDVQYFQVQYEEEYFDRDNEQIWQLILKSAENNTDIMVFPEMVGNPETPEYISAKLKALSAEEQSKMPPLIILPSFYKNKLNTVFMLDRHGEVVCKQSKQNYYIKPVANTGLHLEAITANNVVNILHFDGIGRIAVLICKDFLTTHYMEQLMRCFKLTLIIVPSNSTGSYDFRQSFDLCAHDDCNVVWINTCEALVPGKEANFESIGYVRKRIGRNDDDSQKLCQFPICGGAFSGKCTHDCIYYEIIQGV